MGVKSVGSVSLGIVCGGVCCLTIFVLGTATVRVTVFVSELLRVSVVTRLCNILCNCMKKD